MHNKLSGRFLNMMKLYDEQDFEEMIEEDYEEEEEEEEEPRERRRFGFFGRKREEPDDEDEEEEEKPTVQRTTRVSKPTPEKRTRATSRKGPSIVTIGRGEELKIVKPQSFNESKTITDYLKSNKTVVVNLEGIEITTAQRIIDCIGGASYALGGSLEPISSKIFVVAPKDIEISGDLIDEIAGDGFISPDLGSF